MMASVSRRTQLMEQSSLACLVCGHSSRVVTSLEGRPLFQCRHCGLRFFDVRDVPQQLYEKAYEGKVQSAHMQEYQYRAQHLFNAKADGSAPPSFRLSSNWLRAHARARATVLDVGCGRGIMLRLLRAHGFDALGLDLSPKVADILGAQGFRVHVGTVETYADMPEPEYVTCNYVLHHPTDPVGFLRNIRSRFPLAPLLLTQGMGHSWIHELALLPISPPEYPRDLTTWTTRALSLAFEQAGYARHEFLFTQPSAHEVALPFQRKLMTRAAHRKQPAGSGSQSTRQPRSESSKDAVVHDARALCARATAAARGGAGRGVSLSKLSWRAKQSHDALAF